MSIQEKKITFIQHRLTGGVGGKIAKLANYFSSHGYDIEIFLFRENLIDYDLDRRINVIFLDRTKQKIRDRIDKIKCCIKRKPFSLTESRIVSYFKKNPDRIIIIMLADVVIRVLGFLEHDIISGHVNNKIIVMECGEPATGTTKERDDLRIKYYGMADHCAFLTRDALAYFPEIIQKKGVVIPNPVPSELPERYKGYRRRAIVNFCRLDKAKNLFLTFDAFAILTKEYPDFQLIIYGGGELENELNNYIKELGLTSVAKILPFQKNIHEIVSDCYMFVMSSDHEGFGNSLIEAMAMGLPTICTDWDGGSAKILIKNQENGLLVPKQDVQALYRAMKYMIDNPEEAERMGKNAMKIRNELSLDKIAQKWMELFN